MKHYLFLVYFFTILTPLLALTPPPLKSSYGGYIQSDYYLFHPGGVTDNFKIRSAAVVIKGTVGNHLSFQMTPDFGDGKLNLLDAYIDLRLTPLVSFRSGKSKTPFGLERLQPVTETAFISFRYPTQIAPNRDIGLSIYGHHAKTGLSYATGLFNGAPDGGSSDTDLDNNKEWVGRVFWNITPDIGFGVAQSIGNKSAHSTPPSYSSPGLRKIFNYSTATRLDGTHHRFSPQFYFFSKNGYGFSGEYAVTSQALSNGTSSTTAHHTAYNLIGYYVFTGEAPSYSGLVPHTYFDPTEKTWGALEAVVHLSAIDFDDTVFRNTLASSTSSVSKATTIGAGLNWYLTPNARLSLNLESTAFDKGASQGNKSGETVISSRLRLKF